MKKHVTKVLMLGLTVLVITGCGTASNSVNNGGLIQKRKYTKGFYLNLPQRGRTDEKTAVLSDEQPVERVVIAKQDAKPVYEQPLAAAPESKVIETSSVSSTAIQPEESLHFTEVKPPVVSENPNQSSASTVHRTSTDQSILKQVVDSRKIKQELKKVPDNGEGALFLLLLIVLAFILPPLAVALYEGFTTRFLLDLIFWILGISSGLLIAPWAFVFLVVSVVYALLIVLGG